MTNRPSDALTGHRSAKEIIIGAEIAQAEFFKRGGKAGADGLARMITHCREWSEADQEMVSVEIGPFKDASELKAKPELLYYEAGGPSRSFAVSYPAWNTSFHDYDPEGLEAVRDYLAERGLMPPADLAAWEAAIAEAHRNRAEMEELEATPTAATPGMG